MSARPVILILVCLICFGSPESFAQKTRLSFVDFYGQPVFLNLSTASADSEDVPLSASAITDFYFTQLRDSLSSIVNILQQYKEQNKPDDWLFYQLIRRTAQQLSPKEKKYRLYTLYKWFLLSQTGYDAILTISPSKILFYVQCDENIYNIPTRLKNGKQYVCLNSHDYTPGINFNVEKFEEVELPPAKITQTFSYKVSHIPDISATEYLEKDLHFSYNDNDYHFKVKLTPQIQQLFTNYPVVDYESYLNIPLSPGTYNSLIPQLRARVKGMKARDGVDYLMRFTRYAFLFEEDTKQFGNEKRLSPEQTLFYDQSDCEDRVALFFYLVKEIYNLPMIVLSYPTHIGIAVQFDKPIGRSITYQGAKYSICEPTPQKDDLLLGQMIPALQKVRFEIAYAYRPHH